MLYTFILKPIGNYWINRGLPSMASLYAASLADILCKKSRILLFLTGIFGVLILSFIVFGLFSSGVVLFPTNVEPSSVYVQIESPQGTNVEFTDELVSKAKNQIQSIPNLDDLDNYLSTSGGVLSSGGAGGGQSSHLGTVLLNFKPLPRTLWKYIFSN